jgi:hypothetical protein
MRNIQVHSTHSIRFTNYAKTWCEIINQHRKVFPEHTFKQIAKCYDLSESNVRKQAYTKERKLSTPRVTKSPQIPHKSPQRHINTPKVLDIHSQASYNNSITLRSRLMSVAFHQAQKQKYRVTLEFEVLDDFDPHNLDWEKVFKLEPAEKVSAYVEDLSTPDRW